MISSACQSLVTEYCLSCVYLDEILSESKAYAVDIILKRKHSPPLRFGWGELFSSENFVFQNCSFWCIGVCSWWTPRGIKVLYYCCCLFVNFSRKLSRGKLSSGVLLQTEFKAIGAWFWIKTYLRRVREVPAVWKLGKKDWRLLNRVGWRKLGDRGWVGCCKKLNMFMARYELQRWWFEGLRFLSLPEWQLTQHTSTILSLLRLLPFVTLYELFLSNFLEFNTNSSIKVIKCWLNNTVFYLFGLWRYNPNINSDKLRIHSALI